MPRKAAGTLEQQRNKIKATYKRGRHVERRIVNTDALTEIELATKKEAACFLKAADYSYNYIADALNTTHSIVKGWFAEPSMAARVGEIQTDFVDGATKLLKTYAVELIEMLVEIARTTADDKIAIQAITEALDRMGLGKVSVSKSESINRNVDEIDITDTTGLLAAMKDAPPEVQQQMALKMEEAMALAAEHTDRDVTHG